MQVSAEARLWWQDEYQDALEYWFTKLSSYPPGGALSNYRTDIYLRDPQQVELGIKVREADSPNELVEVKSLVESLSNEGKFGPVTIWTKASSAVLTLHEFPKIATLKQRRLRKFGWDGVDLKEIELNKDEKVLQGHKPDQGCNVELTRVTLKHSKEIWWTLGYEAFGELNEVEQLLRLCIRKTTSGSLPPAVESARPGSYPEWLSWRNSVDS